MTEAPGSPDVRRDAAELLENDKAQPSTGSALDHIGFSFADLDAKMKEFDAAGIKVVTPVRDVAGLFKLGFIEDPWGTRIEVVQDPDEAGAAPCPPARARSGGRARLVQREVRRRDREAEGPHRRAQVAACGCSCSAATRRRATGTRSITSAGARPISRRRRRAESAVGEVHDRAEPLKLASGVVVNFAYLEGPAGAKIELVQR